MCCKYCKQGSKRQTKLTVSLNVYEDPTFLGSFFYSKNINTSKVKKITHKKTLQIHAELFIITGAHSVHHGTVIISCVTDVMLQLLILQDQLLTVNLMQLQLLHQLHLQVMEHQQS